MKYFTIDFIKKLKENIPENILKLDFVNFDCKHMLYNFTVDPFVQNGIVRFNGNELIHIYITVAVSSGDNYETFDYKEIWERVENRVMLKFDYIDNDFIFSGVYVNCYPSIEDPVRRDYRFDVDLKLEREYERVFINNYLPSNYILHPPIQFIDLANILWEQKIIYENHFNQNDEEKDFFGYISRTDNNSIYLMIGADGQLSTAA